MRTWTILKWVIKIFGKRNEQGYRVLYLDEIELCYAKYHNGEVVSIYHREDVIYDRWVNYCPHKRIVDVHPSVASPYPWDQLEPYGECLDCGYVIRDDRSWGPGSAIGIPTRESDEEIPF